MNWEFEKAKRELEEFWDYAHELYEGGKLPMDSADSLKLAQLESAIGETVPVLRAEWCDSKGIGLTDLFRKAMARAVEQSTGTNPT